VSQLCGIAGILGAGLLASISYNLPLLVAGVLMFALGVVAAFLMPETGFHPAGHTDEVSWSARNAWHTAGDTLRQSGRLVRRSPILLTLLGVAAFYGMSSEGFDRLWEAHILLDVHLPALGQLNPVLWFSIILIAAQLLSIASTELARRQVNTRSHVSVARALFAIKALLIVVVIAFGLAVSFPLAVAAYLMADVLRTTRQPIYLAWLTQTIDARVRATVLSISSQLDAFGQIAGGPVIGAIGSLRSIRAALVATGIALTPALALFARAARLKEVQPPDQGVADGATAVVEEVAES
jgi:DHA3 family tetracycline resistance protein-like MFS transporter